MSYSQFIMAVFAIYVVYYAANILEILSIDIADIDVGKNIGAGLQIDQADADLKIAQAKESTTIGGILRKIIRNMVSC